MKIKIAFLLLTLSLSTQAQKLRLLKMTGNPDPNSSSGIGQYFDGHNYNNEVLYFMASWDGLVESLWKTDGTSSGTVKVMDEPGYDTWQSSFYTEDGILLKNKYSHYLTFFDISTDKFNNLYDVGKSTITQITNNSNGHVILARTNDDNVEVYFTDKTASGTFLIGGFDNYTSHLELSSSEYGAVVFNDNSFAEYDHKWIDIKNKKIISLKSFINSFYAIKKVNYGYVFENFLIMQVIKDGFQKNIIVDLKTNEVHDFQYIRKPIDYVKYNDDLILITSKYMVRLNTKTFAHKTIFDKVYSFTPVLKKGDYLYIVGQGWQPDLAKIYEINLTDNTNRLLPDSKIGEVNYYCHFTMYKNELYYTYNPDDDKSQFLVKYDYENETPIIIDTIAVENGGYTIINPLMVIGNKLITSKYNRKLGHELYYLDETSGVFNNELMKNTISVYPTIASSKIHFNQEFKKYQLSIYSINGELVNKSLINGGDLDISTLENGYYFGIIQSREKKYNFRFIKK